MIHNFASFKRFYFKKAIFFIMNWPIAVENEISNLNGTVIIQSQARAHSAPIIWGQEVFGACLHLNTPVLDLAVRLC